MIFHVNRDAFAGVALAIFGAALAIYSYVNYPVGTISRMGPGMFPVMLGTALFAVAVMILLVSLVQQSETVEVNFRTNRAEAGQLVASICAQDAGPVDRTAGNRIRARHVVAAR